MVPPLLKLTFVQGPIQGESREYKPGSTIRVGRVVRGNEITIKDGGISTKHLKIVSDSENWIIQDLGSSNGTTLNLEDLDPDTPLNLSHGDVIRLGGDTIIEVYFVTNIEPPETSKLPPRPRGNKRCLDVSDPDVEPVQEAPKRTRAATRSKTVADEENEPKVVARVGRPRKVAAKKEDEVPVEKKVNPRAGRGRKKNTQSDENPIESVLEVPIDDIADKEKESEVVTRVTRSQRNQKKVEEAPVVEKGNSKVQRGKKNENLGLKSVKLEMESTPMGVEIPPVKRATRSKQIGNVCLGLQNVKSEDITLEEKDEVGVSRATRSRRKEIGGDSYMELDKVLKQARKKKKVIEQKPPEAEEMEVGNDADAEEERENEKDNSVEQVEIEPEKREDGEAEKLEEMGLLEEECPDAGFKNEEAGSETLQKVEQNLSEREEVEARNDVDAGMENEEEIEGCSKRCDEEAELSNRAEQVEIEFEKSSTLEEDGEAEKLEDLGLLQNEFQDSERLYKSEEKQSKSVEIEARNDGDVEKEKENGDEKVFSDDKCETGDEKLKRVEQVENEVKKCSLGEDGETELQEIGSLEEECHDCKSGEMEVGNDDDVQEEEKEDEKGCNDDKIDNEDEFFQRVETSEKVEEECSTKKVDKVEIEECPDADCENEEAGSETLEKVEQKLSESKEVESVIDVVEAGMVNEEEIEGCNESCDKEDELSNKVEQVETEFEKSSTLEEDGEIGKLEDWGLLQNEFQDLERDCKSEEKQVEIESEKLQEMGLLVEECPDTDCKNEEAGSETLQKVGQNLSEREEVEARNDAEAGMENEEDNEGCSERCDEEDELSNRAEQVEIEFEKSSTLEKDGETEKVEDLGLLQNEFQDSERDCKSEEKQSKSVEIEARNDVDVEKEKENGDEKVLSDDKCDTGDEKLKRVEQVENELETVNLQEIGSVEEECHGFKSGEMEVRNDDDVEEKEKEDEKGCNDDKTDNEDELSQSVETSEKVEKEHSTKKVDNKVKIDLEKMTLGEFFDYLEVHLRRQIIRETDEMIEAMRSRALRVQKHIAEQKKAMGKRP